MRLEAAPFDPREIVAQTLQVVSARAGEKKLALTHVVAPDVPAAVVGDAFRVRQILTNLTSNAIKFTERGAVVVAVTVAPGRDGVAVLRFSVRDTGIGITPAARARTSSRRSPRPTARPRAATAAPAWGSASARGSWA